MVHASGNSPRTAWRFISPRSARVGTGLIWRVGWVRLRLSQEDLFKVCGIREVATICFQRTYNVDRDVTLKVCDIKDT